MCTKDPLWIRNGYVSSYCLSVSESVTDPLRIRLREKFASKNGFKNDFFVGFLDPLRTRYGLHIRIRYGSVFLIKRIRNWFRYGSVTNPFAGEIRLKKTDSKTYFLSVFLDPLRTRYGLHIRIRYGSVFCNKNDLIFC